MFHLPTPLIPSLLSFSWHLKSWFHSDYYLAASSQSSKLHSLYFPQHTKKLLHPHKLTAATAAAIEAWCKTKRCQVREMWSQSQALLLKNLQRFSWLNVQLFVFVPLFLVKHPLTFYITETLLLLTHIVTSCRLAYRINRNLWVTRLHTNWNRCGNLQAILLR